MKRIIFLGLLFVYLFLFYYYFSKRNKECSMNNPPKNVETYNEIAIQYNKNIVNYYNDLTPQERIFCYYLFRASLPGNKISADQIHRNSLDVINVFETICNNEKKLNENISDFSFSINKFIQQAKTFLVYLWTNHGQYFQREHNNEKRTPVKVGLDLLTKENIVRVFEKLGQDHLSKKVLDLEKTIFDETYEPTCTIPNNIEASACNFYSHDFTQKHYENLPEIDRGHINVYFSVIDEKPVILPYAVGKKYDKELGVSAFWLKQAEEIAKKYPKQFDQYMIKSLEHLISFLQTGNEDFFKKHSIEWLKSKSRIDYNFGFIETYHDPKSIRGSFQVEVTIKILNIDKLNSILPAIESEMPFPPLFKRESIKSIPNASINCKLFGAGGLGPMNITAAYCLPNYEEIRSKHGSKQIIYPADESIEHKLNPELSRKLFNLKNDALWLDKNDPEGKLSLDIWNAQCILHETIGHGSGKLSKHKFVDGDILFVNGVKYNIGDEISVTSKNLGELLQGYEHTIEEMRAEIIALYVSVNYLSKLQECDLLVDWKDFFNNNQLEEKLVIGMANTGLRRLIQQSDGAIEVSGDHARANYTILNYLIDNGALSLKEEKINVGQKEFTVLGLVVNDMNKAKEHIKILMVEVQRIKSTGDGVKAKELVAKYGIKFRDESHIKILKENRRRIVGDIKCSAMIYPHFKPVYDKKENVIDIQTSWPKDIFEQYNFYKEIEMATR